MDSTSKSSEQRLEEVLRQNAELQHLIYAAAHDLKQPLRTISNYAQLLQRQYRGDHNASELTSFIVGAVNEMTKLIEDLLKYSRLGNSPRRTQVNLNAIVQWALVTLQKRIGETDAQIRCGDLPEVAIDESQFVQVFQQLFSNALNFRGSGPPVIEVTAEEQEDVCLISVRDNGQGIDSRFHEQIFEPFKRLHGKEVPGSGLGLALCRKVVQAHGGKIWVESDGTHGSVFKISVPA